MEVSTEELQELIESNSQSQPNSLIIKQSSLKITQEGKCLSQL